MRIIPHYILGYLCFLESVVQGKQSVSAEEFELILKSLINVVQVKVTNSPHSDYNDQTWAAAREYGDI